jgi:hypothetical protein
MGLEYVFASELKLRTCPYCGSNTFNVTVGRKVEAEEKWSWEDDKRRILERTDDGVGSHLRREMCHLWKGLMGLCGR